MVRWKCFKKAEGFGIFDIKLIQERNKRLICLIGLNTSPKLFKLDEKKNEGFLIYQCSPPVSENYL